MPQEEVMLSFTEGLDKIARKIEERKAIDVGSFWEFTRDTWSLGYDHPEYFGYWHIGVICDDVEKALSEGKNYVAILPRMHFKSTILGHAFSVWQMLRGRSDTDILYLSFSDGMAVHHMTEIKRHIQRNEKIQDMLTDKTPQAESAIRYELNSRRLRIIHGGVFSFKRGAHVNGAMIADDILRDPANPLNATVLMKVEEHFMKECMYIPLRNVPVIVLGTPMLPGDLLAKLVADDRFNHRILPVFDPVPGRRVLMPELYDEEWLMREKKERPRAFASEFMLAPYLSSASYFSEADIEEIEDSSLKSLDVRIEHDLPEETIVAGFDIGKKRHPSHLSVFVHRNGKLVQIHQSFLDDMSYVDQVHYLNDAAEHFRISRGYIDNTRGELEERGLHPAWKFMRFTQKNKLTMAQILEKYINEKSISLIKDDRQRSQITAVDGELKAAETPLGHGDSFFSNTMAVLAFHELMKQGTTTIGGLQDVSDAFDSAHPSETSSRIAKLLYNMKSGEETDSCPKCNNSKGWIPARKLCLICYYRG